MDETDLLISFRSQEPTAALEQLFDAYADRVYRLGLSLLGNEQQAEDVVQQTFLNILANRDRFEARSSFGSWIFRIAYNAGQDILRRRPETALPGEDESAGEEDSIPLPQNLVEWQWTPEEMLGDSEAQSMIEEAVQRLPVKLRSVFHLRDVEELSIEETAAILGITPSAVKVRLHRARLALREMLSSYFFEWSTQRS